MEKIRREIDRIDEKILALLNQRAKLALQIARFKSKRRRNFYVPERERKIMEKLIKKNKGPFSAKGLRAVYQEILSACRNLQQVLKIAYAGQEGSFAHRASIQRFGTSVEYIPARNVGEIFEKVEQGEVNFGVVPVENSREASVGYTLDMFIDSPLKINDEIILEVARKYMRFLVIEKQSAPCLSRGKYKVKAKTSLIFSLKDRPGALYRCLSHFVRNNINLARIESRPSLKKPWDYIFFVDVEGHLMQPGIKRVLAKLKRICLYLKVLGSYPQA